MLNYIIRRVLLMIPTLIGITIMVFLIARFAPGRPGQLQIEGAGMGAEEAKAMAQWYEKRYGLDLPLWRQYLRWWRGMFVRDVQALAWLDGDELRPVFTTRKLEPEYFARGEDGRWYAAATLQFDAQNHVADDAAFLDAVHADQLSVHPSRQAGRYADPVHVLAKGRFTSIDSLDADRDTLLKRATRMVDVMVDAPVWSSPAGDALFVDPNQPDRLLLQRQGQWMEFHPNMPPAQALVNPVDAPAVAAVLKSKLAELPRADEKYSLPRHAFLTGRTQPLDENIDAGHLQRLTIRTPAKSPAGVWAPVGDDPKATTLYQTVDPVPMLMVQVGPTWNRLIGPTRAQPASATVVRQSGIPESKQAGFQPADDKQREPRHALLRGTLLPLDQPPAERDIRRYQHEASVFEVTLGESIFSQTTVMEELRLRLPVTLMINLIAFPLIYLFAIPCGMLMAVKRGRVFDAGANITLLGLWSVPQVLAATLLIAYLAIGGAGAHWFPSTGLSSVGAESLPFSGWLMDRIWHLILPVVCILYSSVAYIAKQQRAAMLDNFTMDYVRTAKAKGVPGKDIVFRHVLRNSLLPLITIVATILPVLIAGSIILEKIFSIEGMGLLALRAVQNRDYDVVQSLALIAGVLNLIGLLLADICYALADPRITYK